MKQTTTKTTLTEMARTMVAMSTMTIREVDGEGYRACKNAVIRHVESLPGLYLDAWMTHSSDGDRPHVLSVILSVVADDETDEDAVAVQGLDRPEQSSPRTCRRKHQHLDVAPVAASDVESCELAVALLVATGSSQSGGGEGRESQQPPQRSANPLRSPRFASDQSMVASPRGCSRLAPELASGAGGSAEVERSHQRRAS